MLRVAASPMEPRVLCSSDYQTLQLHRACPSTGLSATSPDAAKFHVAPERGGSCQSQGKDRSWPVIRGTAKRSLLKEAAGREADLGNRKSQLCVTRNKTGSCVHARTVSLQSYPLFLLPHWTCYGKHVPETRSLCAHCHLPLPHFPSRDGLVVSISQPQVNISVNWRKDSDAAAFLYKAALQEPFCHFAFWKPSRLPRISFFFGLQVQVPRWGNRYQHSSVSNSNPVLSDA